MKPESRTLLWRVHGLAALLALPFLLIATVTGLIYLPTPQVEAWQGRAWQSVPAGPVLNLDSLVAQAQEAAPEGLRLRHVSPPARPGESLRVQFAPPPQGGPGAHRDHAGHPGHGGPGGGAAAEPVDVYVDPGTGAVLGEQRESERYSTWAKQLHSRLQLGEGARWMIEWAATCLLVMLVTGLALAWPRAGDSLSPRQAPAGRLRWRAWHRLVGLLLGGLSLIIVLTGLTWSQTAGSQVRAARDWAQQGAPRAPADLRSTPQPGAAPLGYEAVWRRAEQLAPGVRLQLTPPRAAGGDGVWRVQTVDRHLPGRRAELVLDAYSGALLWQSRWADLPAFAQATAIGIPFHRGEFGLWNQALLLVFGLGLLVSTATGVLMAGARWRRGQALLPVLRTRQGLGWRWPLLAASLLLCALIPLLAAFLLFLLAVEWRAARAPAVAA